MLTAGADHHVLTTKMRCFSYTLSLTHTKAGRAPFTWEPLTPFFSPSPWRGNGWKQGGESLAVTLTASLYNGIL